MKVTLTDYGECWVNIQNGNNELHIESGEYSVFDIETFLREVFDVGKRGEEFEVEHLDISEEFEDFQ